jgi:hypothetical protein
VAAGAAAHNRLDEGPMNRLKMRTLLRRRLQEDTPDRWQNEDLNELLDQGVLEVQKRLLAIDPEAVKATDVADTVGGQDYYALPPETWTVVKVETSQDGARYTPLDRLTDHQADAGDAGFVLHSSGYIRLSPAPSASVVGGLRLTHVPGLRMGEDGANCGLPDSLHMTAVKCAQKLALAEVGEPTDRIETDINADLNLLQLFHTPASQPTRFEVDFQHDYDR